MNGNDTIAIPFRNPSCVARHINNLRTPLCTLTGYVSVFSSLKDESRPAETTAEPPWLVLSVEDDTDYQATLAFALSGLEVAGRPVELITAQSATDAAKIIA